MIKSKQVQAAGGRAYSWNCMENHAFVGHVILFKANYNIMETKRMQNQLGICCCWAAALLVAVINPRTPVCAAGDEGLDIWLEADRAEPGAGLWMEWTLCRLVMLCDPVTYTITDQTKHNAAQQKLL